MSRGVISDARPERIQTLPLLVFLINVAMTGVLMMYSFLNLRPDLPPSASAHPATYHRATLYLTFLLPTAATSIYLWPISRWLSTVWKRRTNGSTVNAAQSVVRRVAPCALVVTGTPIDLARVVPIHRPVARVRYDAEERDPTTKWLDIEGDSA